MPTLRSLSANLPVTMLGDPATPISGIQYDSRRVRAGDLFACLPGAKVHGHAFIPQALAAGAVALLVEDAAQVPPGVPAIVVEQPREALAHLAAAYYGHPAEALTVIGVTGTNGKTTVTTLAWRILQAAGHPAGLIGTMAYHLGDAVLPAPFTTPEALDLQAYFARMRDAGLTHVVMEVSSHALCQHRVTGTRFHYAGFTNLTQDHLDYHGTLEAYREAKLSLFADPRYQPSDRAMLGLINADDPSAAVFADRALGPVRWYGLRSGDYHADAVTLRADGSDFLLRYPGGAVPVRTRLVGSFNVANVTLALALAIEAGVDAARAAAIVADIPPIDGRFQRVPEGGNGKPSVIVDYAHTPDGLDKVLRTAYEIAPGRVITVFGCGGNRDAGKRPQMAAVAAHWSRRIVVTSDNPRDEDPAAIIAEILRGFGPDDLARVVVEMDRAAAVRYAITNAAPDDLVILAGKGHEDYQIFAGGHRIHFDDREQAVLALSAWPG